VSAHNPHVLIAGGGVGGPALFLKKAGISCAIYEAYPHTEGVGGGLNLAPNGMNVLADLGLAETLRRRATIARESVFADERGRPPGRLPYGDPNRYGQPAVSMSHALLFGLLAEELRREEIPILYEKRVRGVEESGDTVTIHFADGDSAQGDLLIGADGVRSVVRSSLLPNGPHPSYTGIVGIGGFTPLSALPAIPQADIAALTYTFGPRGFFGYGGADNGTMMWWSNLWRTREFSHEELANLDQ
jgi:2-polyprenyl-6-methoxyphenol hydroxylase-like FAD-dependent oxidoreductase